MEGNRKPGGFTMVEMLISVAIVAILALGLERVLATALSSSGSVTEKQDALMRARLAMERMVSFVQETDEVVYPAGSNEEMLKVSERLLDTYDNGTHAYLIAGDGKPDADNDGDGLVNEGGPGDTADYITFTLDKTDGGNWKLMEQMPDYSTTPSGLSTAKVICEHVTRFQCSRFSTDLVTIHLAVNNGKAAISLQTRARARRVLP